MMAPESRPMTFAVRGEVRRTAFEHIATEL